MLRFLILIPLLLVGCQDDPRIVKLELKKDDSQLGERLLRRAQEIRDMVDCTNAALDSKMNDRDQVLTIETCFKNAGYR